MFENQIAALWAMHKARLQKEKIFNDKKAEYDRILQDITRYQIEGKIKEKVDAVYNSVNQCFTFLSNAVKELSPTVDKTLAEIMQKNKPSYNKENFLEELKNNYEKFREQVKRINSLKDVTPDLLSKLVLAYNNINDIRMHVSEYNAQYIAERKVKETYTAKVTEERAQYVKVATEELNKDKTEALAKIAELEDGLKEIEKKAEEWSKFPVPPVTKNGFGSIKVCIGKSKKKNYQAVVQDFSAYGKKVITSMQKQAYFIDFAQTANVVIKYNPIDDSNDGVWAFIRTIALKFVLAYPSTLKKIAALEGCMLGSKFVGLYNLLGKSAENNALIFGEDKRPATTEDKIRSVIKELMEVAAERENLLSGTDILTYNSQNEDNAQPLILAFIKDVNFDEREVAIMKELLRNGARLGIYTVMLGTEDNLVGNFEMLRGAKPKTIGYGEEAKQVKVSFAESLSKLKESTRISVDTYEFENGALLKGEDAITLPENASVTQDGSYYEKVKKAMKDMSVIDLLTLHKGYNKPREDDFSRRLVIPIGKHGAEVATLDLDSKSMGVNAIMAGVPGSGKTSLLHSIILGTAYHYSPDEVQFWLLDLKNGGPEFKRYERLKHVRFLSLDSNKEDMFDLFSYLDFVMTKRGALMGGEGSNIVTYNASQPEGKKLPRIIVLIDEYAEIGNSMKCLDALEAIAKKGRALGVTLVLSSQFAEFSKLTALCQHKFEFANDRYALIDDAKKYGDLSKKGTCVYAGVGDTRKYMRIAYAEDKEKDEFIDYINDVKWKDCKQGKIDRLEDPEILTYEGKIPTEKQCLSRDGYSTAIKVVLGEKRFTREPVVYKIDEKNKFLVLLGNERRASQVEEIVANTFVGLKANEPLVYYINTTTSKTLVQKNAEKYPGKIRVTQKPFDIIDILKEVSQIYERRQEMVDDGEDVKYPIEIMIHGADRVKDLLKRAAARQNQKPKKQSAYSPSFSNAASAGMDDLDDDEFFAKLDEMREKGMSSEPAYSPYGDSNEEFDVMDALRNLYHASEDCKINLILHFSDAATMDDSFWDEFTRNAKDAIIAPSLPEDENDYKECYAEIIKALRALRLTGDELLDIYEGLSKKVGLERDKSKFNYMILVDEHISSRYLPLERKGEAENG